MLSAIQVIEHVFTEFSVRAHDKASPEIAHTAKYGVRTSREDKHEERIWRVDMVYSFGKSDAEKNAPYEGTIRLHGYFVIHPDFPEEKCDSLARLNGGAVLMGAVREAVLGHTLRSVNGPLELPLVDARSFLPKDQQDQPLIPVSMEKEPSE